MANQTPGEDSHYNLGRAASRRHLWIAFALTTSFMLAEVVGGLVANSLALLADAGHMVTDAVSIGVALSALWVGQLSASRRHTFGLQRAEILASLFNAAALWAIAAWILFDAFRRLTETPDVDATVMLWLGGAGLAVNAASAYVLNRSRGESLNVEGAFLHVLGDMLGSIGVVASGALILLFGWTIADPLIAMAIAVLVLISSARLLRQVVHVLMQATPAKIDLDYLCSRMERLPGVAGVHDIHIWSVTTGYEVLTAHVNVNSGAGEADQEGLLESIREMAAHEFGISHVTIQVEGAETGCPERHHTAHEPTGG
ncbi:MAG: cation diffusion facilitator family transporter [Chloroflexota bacterium]